MRAFSAWLLHVAEKFYLKSHGWRREAPDMWISPHDSAPRYRLQARAVASQKFHSSWSQYP